MTTSPLSDDVFADAFALLAAAADVPGCKARLAELAKQIAAAEKALRKLDADTAEHERKVAADTAELAEREAALRKRQVDVMIRENAMAETAKIRGLSDDRFHLDPNLGPGGRSYSGLTRAHEVE
jgi:septal ring factor EnvC (AmiA/AmiB activator)